ncbi:STAS domain-containing protein [Micromonospora sp. CPCC 206061]|uniref:STAS domain-containing protein n=1 Tax=Micromonospora sp. CPCC 206061 TaxID=3122410 RepID=UPI002FF28055
MFTTTFSPVTTSAQLHIGISYPSPATARVAVVGEVDLATTPLLRERLLRMLRDERPDLLDVDLTGVTFLDCTGLGVLVAVRSAAVQAGCQMRVSHPQPIVRRVLEVTGLLSVFAVPTIAPAPAPAGIGYPSRVGPTPTDVTQPVLQQGRRPGRLTCGVSP